MMDQTAAGYATVVAAVVLVAFLGTQSAVAALATTGQQPMTFTEDVPRSPEAVEWQNASTRTVTLSKQQIAVPYGGGSVDQLQVSAVTNETHVAFKLRWNDSTTDTAIDSPQTYSDAAAIMLKSGSKPPITMGASGTPVNIWYWRASWEHGGDAVRGEWTGDMYAYPNPSAATKPGRAADNPLARPEYEAYGQNYYAKGFGSLTHAPAQNVQASGERTEDGWEVVFVRERSTDGTYDAPFNDSANLYLAFAVWNGSAGDVNGEKSITLQFSTLDPQTQTLQAAQDGGGQNQQETPGASSGAGEQGPGEWFAGSFWNGMLTVLAVVVVAWTLAYWRLRGVEGPGGRRR